MALAHAATSDAKRQYNKEYYQTHKDYWVNYYKNGHGIGRKKKENDVESDMKKLQAYESKLDALSSKIGQYRDMMNDYNASDEEIRFAKRNYEGLVKQYHQLRNDPEFERVAKVAYNEEMRKRGPELVREEMGRSQIQNQGRPYAKVEKKYKHGGGGSKW